MTHHKTLSNGLAILLVVVSIMCGGLAILFLAAGKLPLILLAAAAAAVTAWAAFAVSGDRRSAHR